MGKPKLGENSRKLACEQVDLIFDTFLELPPVAVRDGVMQDCKDARLDTVVWPRLRCFLRGRTHRTTLQTYHNY